jgi:RNase H-like domain found in reverse transcriptase/Integrase zinc binding domain/Reverse transcriptase (RNA-dependent DNA polymerase)
MGYNNVLIKVEDRWKAAFKTPYRLYQPKVMFFSLTNSPATFQHMMDHIFHCLQDKYPGMIFIYMDDILVATIKDYDLHRWIVHEVLDLLEEESFFLKPAKCKFEQQLINYLRIVVTKGTVCIDPTKQNGLAAWPRWLTLVKQVCSTLGVLGYQRPFIWGFTHLAQPITQLLKKEKKFEWTEECTVALDKLIGIVTSDPVLHQPNYNLPFTLEVDALQYATGAILYQPNDKGWLCPVGYHSHTLNPAERGYDVHDWELLAIMRGLRQWQHLLLSLPFTTTIIMDHANLQYYWQPQKINCRVARYLANLANYWFKLIHKPGVSNKADHLSRWPDYDEGKEDNEDVQVLPDKLFVNAVVSLNIEQEVYNRQGAAAPQIQQWVKDHGLTSVNHHWFKGVRPVVADNLSLQQSVLRMYHDHESAEHLGIFNTYASVVQDYWWPDMKCFVVQYVKGCAICQSTKPNTVWPKVPIYPIMTTETHAYPFQTISWDLITDLPKKGNFDSALTIVDHNCSKAALLLPCSKEINTSEVAALYAQQVFPHYGVLRKIISDRDPHFTTAFARAVCAQLNIKQNISTVYHPQHVSCLSSHAI